ncbi:hypothetical protein B0T11DRAFT_326418 [Plectosphaerella cucumerina]|uniref:Uncharacterized protein n=1 Tax=Plectosphaerella cucumerina TaxID=40658 RepID=A0A8K0X743_9PEZI|nr:hypothetical protein B0T11DRAFT_326418 [Plectosphaerella cucumerina]
MTKIQINKDDSAWNMASESASRDTGDSINASRFDSSDSEAEFVDSHEDQQTWVEVQQIQPRAVVTEADAVAFIEASLSAPTMTPAEVYRCNHPDRHPAYGPPLTMEFCPRQSEEQALADAASRPQRQWLIPMHDIVTNPLVSAAQFMAVNLLRRQYGPADWTAYQIAFRRVNPPEPIEEGWVLDGELVTIEEKQEDENGKTNDVKGKSKETKEENTQDHIEDNWEEVPEIYCRLPSREYPAPPTIMERGKKVAGAVQKDVAKKIDTATRLVTK